MSAVEVAFLMTAKNKEYSLKKRYKAYKNYVTDQRVTELIAGFELGPAGGIKKIPFLLLKWKWYGALFMAVTMLHLIHYEFNRG